MIVRYLKLKNWRNFRELEISLKQRTYIIGPNASGKSNLLDVFRFLRDIAKLGGGLQKAVDDRGGITKVRSLLARRGPVHVEVHLSPSIDAEVVWKYELGFKGQGSGHNLIAVEYERVWHAGNIILERPNEADKRDRERLTQTFLEQINSNEEFRDTVKFFETITYLHLVPQLLKFSQQISGNRLDDDPFGQGFLEKLA